MENPDIRLVCDVCGREIEYSNHIKPVIDNIRKKTYEFELDKDEIRQLVIDTIKIGNELGGWRKIDGKWRCPVCTGHKKSGSEPIIGEFHW